MLAEKTNIDLKKDSQNLLLLIFTISLFSFFIFNENRALAFVITFLISLIAVVLLLYFTFSNHSKKEIRKTILKDHNYSFDDIRKPIVDIDVVDEEYMTTTFESLNDPREPTKYKYGSYFSHFNIIKNYESDLSDKFDELVQFNKRLIDFSYHTTPRKSFSKIEKFDSTLPNLLKEYGKILDSDNGIEYSSFSNEDINSLILKMNICLGKIEGTYINNQYSKQISVEILKTAIDYLMEKDLMANPSGNEPDFFNIK